MKSSWQEHHVVFVSQMLATLGHQTRWRLLHLLAPQTLSDPPGLVERRPQELAALLEVAPSTLSEHLNKLAELPLVVARRQGRARLYRLANTPFLLSFLNLLGQIEEAFPDAEKIPGSVSLQSMDEA